MVGYGGSIADVLSPRVHIYIVFEYEINLLFITLLYLYPMLDLKHDILWLNLNALLFRKV